VFLNRQSADQHQSKKLLLPNVFSILQLMGKGDSKDRKMSEK
jgi:hypothetical protein